MASPAACPHVSGTAKAYAAAAEAYLATSKLAMWDKKGNKGVWRTFLVREATAAAPAGPWEAFFRPTLPPTLPPTDAAAGAMVAPPAPAPAYAADSVPEREAAPTSDAQVLIMMQLVSKLSL